MIDKVQVKGREIQMSIDHAEVISFYVNLKNSHIGVDVALMNGQKVVTVHKMDTYSYNKENPYKYIEISPGMRRAIEDLSASISHEINYRLNVAGRMLPEPEGE